MTEETSPSQMINENTELLVEKLPWLKSTSPSDLIEERSQTFRIATKLFPRNIANQIKIVYAFVRIPDDLVDVPRAQQLEKRPIFNAYEEVYNHALKHNTVAGIPVIDEFIKLSLQLRFPEEWAAAFLNAMKQDFNNNTFQLEDELKTYTYGSAAVIGLMCAKIFGISEVQDFEYAARLGDAFQLINFIRDIYDDTKLGRNYIPKDDFIRLNIHEPEDPQGVIQMNTEEFTKLVHFEIERFKTWLRDGLLGIPSVIEKSPRAAIAVLSAAFMYEQIAKKIYTNPELIKSGKVGINKRQKLLSFARASFQVGYFLLVGNTLKLTTKNNNLFLSKPEEP